jgi:3D (Asp-Asp-Asp) domain-containing protein
MAMPPRALRRNRLLFGGFVIAMLPVIALATGLLNRKPHPGPLLVSMNELAWTPISPTKSNTAPAVSRKPQIPASALPLIADAEHLLMTAAVSSDDETAPVVGSAPTPTAQRFFNGRPLRVAKTITMEVTAYSPDERSCGLHADGTTASGYSVWTNGMKLVAADTSVLPFGSLVSVPGYDDDSVVPVLDRGGAIKGNRLDVLYATHEQAQRWGRQTLQVTVWEYADGKGSDFEPRYHRASSVVARR